MSVECFTPRLSSSSRTSLENSLRFEILCTNYVINYFILSKVTKLTIILTCQKSTNWLSSLTCSKSSKEPVCEYFYLHIFTSQYWGATLPEVCPNTGFFSGPYFSVFSSNIGKYGPEKTLYLDNFMLCYENQIWGAGTPP